MFFRGFVPTVLLVRTFLVTGKSETDGWMRRDGRDGRDGVGKDKVTEDVHRAASAPIRTL